MLIRAIALSGRLSEVPVLKKTEEIVRGSSDAPV